VSAIAADSCCCWKKAVPSSWVSWATLARRRYPAGPAAEGGSGAAWHLPFLDMLHLSVPIFPLSALQFVWRPSFQLGIMHTLFYLVPRVL
jgi:hypothetical protein